MANVYRIAPEGVYLTVGDGLEAIIDAEDLPRVSGYTWRAYVHARTRDGSRHYVQSRMGAKTVYLHRVVMNAPKGRHVDHINHDTLDNRKANLRIVSNQENNMNREGAYSTSKIGVRGVCVHTIKGKTYYIFVCHGKACRTRKYFPYTEEGLEKATAFSAAHHAAAFAGTPDVQAKRPTATGIRGITVQRYKGVPKYYIAERVIRGERLTKIFPYSPDGLERAKQALADMLAQ